MSFLKRIRPGTSLVPEWAGFFTPAEYSRFRKLVNGWLAQRARGFTEVAGGAIELDLGSDRAVTIGLSNLAQKCRLAAAEDWPALVADHLDAVVRNDSLTEDTTFDAAREMLKVRIYPEDYGAGMPNADSLLVKRPLAPGAVAALAIDYPRTVASVSREMAAGWGVPVDELFEVGLANVRAGDRPEVQNRDLDTGGRVSFLVSESFFTATWVLLLDEFVTPPSPHGELVAIPTRHVVAFMPIVDLSIVEGISTLIGTAAHLYDQGPGPISSNIYWRRGDSLTLLPTTIEGQTVRFAPPDEFIETLNQLHKPAPSQ
jgi:hypothetical protein